MALKMSYVTCISHKRRSNAPPLPSIQSSPDPESRSGHAAYRMRKRRPCSAGSAGPKRMVSLFVFDCGGVDAYDCRRPKGAPRFRCRACKKDFADHVGNAIRVRHKLPLRSYLAAIAIFCNEVKGKSSLALSRDLGIAHKTALVLQHKLREAMGEELKGRMMAGK